MKSRTILYWIGIPVLLLTATVASAQSYEAQQLILDVEKLAQLKQILSDLKEGYQVLDAGYSTIRDIAQGNFNLHKTFLDGLLAVSPAVRDYERIAEIVQLQATLLSRYQASWASLQKGHFSPDEVVMMGQIFNNLLQASAQDIIDLIDVVTNGTIRASDAERMRQIDGIYTGMLSKATVLDRLVNSAGLLSQQRQTGLNETQSIRQLYDIQP